MDSASFYIGQQNTELKTLCRARPSAFRMSDRVARKAFVVRATLFTCE
jgi:hypothetical protein